MPVTLRGHSWFVLCVYSEEGGGNHFGGYEKVWRRGEKILSVEVVTRNIDVRRESAVRGIVLAWEEGCTPVV